MKWEQPDEPLLAEFTTRCPCGELIEPGDEITKSDEGYVHKECA